MQADLANKAHRAHERLKYIKQKNIRKHCSPPQPHPIPYPRILIRLQRGVASPHIIPTDFNPLIKKPQPRPILYQRILIR